MMGIQPTSQRPPACFRFRLVLIVNAKRWIVMVMEHFLLAAEYSAFFKTSCTTYHQLFHLFHVAHILRPVSIAEPAARQNHSQSQLRNCYLWNANFRVQELVALHIKNKSIDFTFLVPRVSLDMYHSNECCGLGHFITHTPRNGGAVRCLHRISLNSSPPRTAECLISPYPIQTWCLEGTHCHSDAQSLITPASSCLCLVSISQSCV